MRLDKVRLLTVLHIPGSRKGHSDVSVPAPEEPRFLARTENKNIVDRRKRPAPSRLC